MAFMLGAFTSGLASGAKNAMNLYSEYEGIKSKKELSNSLTNAMGGDKKPTAPAGAQPGQATGAVQTDSGSFLGNAQSDSAASAPKQDHSGDPRTPRASAALGAFGSAMSDSAASAPGRSPYGNAKSDSAMSGPSSQGQEPQQAGVQGNPAGDVWPSATAPTQQSGVSTDAKPFGASVADWVLGRNPQDRAVHLTPTMGIATGPGPSRTPMSTSPGGRPPPQYLPQQRPAPLAAAPTQTAPSLANQQSPIGQAIQTQYGNGGM